MLHLRHKLHSFQIGMKLAFELIPESRMIELLIDFTLTVRTSVPPSVRPSIRTSVPPSVPFCISTVESCVCSLWDSFKLAHC